MATNHGTIDCREVLCMSTCPICKKIYDPAKGTVCPVCSIKDALMALGMSDDKVAAFMAEVARA